MYVFLRLFLVQKRCPQTCPQTASDEDKCLDISEDKFEDEDNCEDEVVGKSEGSLSNKFVLRHVLM